MLGALGDLGDFIGGIGVVLTLAYLATQVKLHSAALRTASRQDLSAAYRTHNSQLLDPRISGIYAAGLRTYPQMPSEDRRIFAHTINDHALFLQNAFALYESGSLGLANYSPYLDWFSCAVATPGGAAWWAETKPFYNVALVESVDERLASGEIPDVLALDLGLLAAEGG